MPIAAPAGGFHQRPAMNGRLLVAAMVMLSGCAGNVRAQQAASPPRVPIQTDTLRMEDMIRQVVLHNDQVAAARFMEQAASARVGPAGAWDDPMLMAGVVNLPTSLSFTEDGMTMTMLGLSQRIPYAGEKGLSVKAARAEAKAAREDLQETILKLAAAAKSAYADVYYRGLILDALERQHDLLGEIIQSLRTRLAANLTNQEDVAAAQAELWRLESQILSARQELDAAWFNLNALSGSDSPSVLPKLVEPTFPIVPDSVATWLDAARAHYPPVLRLRHQAAGYGYSAAAARRMRWPMLDVSANYGIRRNNIMEQRDDMIGFSATLSLPIFSGRQQARMAHSMTAMEQSTSAEAEQLRRDTEATLRALHQRALRLEESLSLYRERILPTDDDAYRSAFAGFQSNRTTFATLLNYSAAVYRDRVTADMLANELARTLAEVERYITNADDLIADSETETR